jgi:hypothetical protein
LRCIYNQDLGLVANERGHQNLVNNDDFLKWSNLKKKYFFKKKIIIDSES